MEEFAAITFSFDCREFGVFLRMDRLALGKKLVIETATTTMSRGMEGLIEVK
jgi:hypothetical protein